MPLSGLGPSSHSWSSSMPWCSAAPEAVTVAASATHCNIVITIIITVINVIILLTWSVKSWPGPGSWATVGVGVAGGYSGVWAGWYTGPPWPPYPGNPGVVSENCGVAQVGVCPGGG